MNQILTPIQIVDQYFTHLSMGALALIMVLYAFASVGQYLRGGEERDALFASLRSGLMPIPMVIMTMMLIYGCTVAVRNAGLEQFGTWVLTVASLWAGWQVTHRAVLAARH